VGATSTPLARHDGELLLMFVLVGGATVETDGQRIALMRADSIVVPPGQPFRLADCSPDLELLEVTVPGPLTLTDVGASGDA
jgi:mannose-6-phosphate isomerase-like protein (cupin superfamily)